MTTLHSCDVLDHPLFCCVTADGLKLVLSGTNKVSTKSPSQSQNALNRVAVAVISISYRPGTGAVTK